jgi:hypothetical protein
MLRAFTSAASGSRGPLPALWRLQRAVTSSSTSNQAQPQAAALEPKHEAGPPRWVRELGVVRNDWT